MRQDTIRDPGRIRRMFGEIAASYDTLNHVLSLNRDRAWRRRTAGTESAPDSVLDLCAGTGDMALEWARKKGAGRVVAADFCEGMLRRCREKTERAGLSSRVRVVVADARSLPFRDREFAMVCVSFGIRNVSDLRRGIGEMVRVAGAGGEVRILEFTMPGNLLFRGIYLFYFLLLLPIIGNLVSGSEESAYGYLPRSVLRFPGCRELAGMLESAGLAEVRVTNLSMGIVTLLVGRKGG